MELNDIIQKRGEIHAQMKDILERMNSQLAKDGSYSKEDETQYNKLEEAYDKYSAQQERMAKQRELDAKIATAHTEPVSLPMPDEQRSKLVAVKGGAPAAAGADEETQLRAAYAKYIRSGKDSLTGEERRALQADQDIYGGFMVMPMQVVADLIKAIDDEVFVRRFATVHSNVRAGSLGVPSLDVDPSDADWTAEIRTGNEDSAMKLGGRELTPHPLAKRIKISRKLLSASPAVEALVRARLAYKFGITEEKGFLTGDGAGKALGLFTASTQGISTGRDVSTGNTTTAISADNLIECKYTLKAAYWARARWILHRLVLKAIRKLKDGNGQYIWAPGLAGGQPDTILDMPFSVSEFAPSTFTTGQYMTVLGDLKHYQIAEAAAMQLQRLDELYAETNQVGFIGRMEVDGMPDLEEAFVRSVLA